VTPQTPYVLRSCVSRWLRIRVQHDKMLEGRYRQLMAAGDVKALFMQLAADADHSALLVRLFEGKEPLLEPPPVENAYPAYPD
jgi:hypothetical protein